MTSVPFYGCRLSEVCAIRVVSGFYPLPDDDEFTDLSRKSLIGFRFDGVQVDAARYILKVAAHEVPLDRTVAGTSVERQFDDHVSRYRVDPDHALVHRKVPELDFDARRVVVVWGGGIDRMMLVQTGEMS